MCSFRKNEMAKRAKVRAFGESNESLHEESSDASTDSGIASVRSDTSMNSRLSGEMSFADLNTHAMEFAVRYMSDDMLFKVAVINRRHFSKMRYYFDARPCLNMYINSAKQCISREPCRQVTFYHCQHRVIRKMSVWISMFKIKAIEPRALYIFSPMAPRQMRKQIKGTSKILKNLSPSEFSSYFVCDPCLVLERVYVSVSEEKHYVKPLKELLTRNKEYLRLFHVRDTDMNHSNLYFPDFKDVSKFGKEGWFTERGRNRKRKALETA